MNKFHDMLEKIRKRAVEDNNIKDLLAELDETDKLGEGLSREETRYRLPYSSDPRPIEEPWK
ncbi:MAG: hypothetical protein R3D62_04975 [Xanthobacteraceae bacterium]